MTGVMPRATACCIWGGQEPTTGEPASAARARRLLTTLAAAAVVTSAWLVSPFAVDVASAQRLLQISGASRTATVLVPVGKTEDLRIDTPFTDITVGDPEVADVAPLTDRAISVLGKKIGTTRVTVYAEGRRHVGIFDIEVTYEVSRLAVEVARVAGPGIRVSSVNGRIMLSGEAPDAVTLDRAVTIARQFAPEIINTVTIASPQQVMLEVRFVEASRQAGRELGVQWNVFNSRMSANIGSRQPANRLPITAPTSPTNIPIGEVAAGVLSGASPFGFMLGRMLAGGTTIDVLINALEQKGLVRTLAEPNLTALSGDTASFLAGGEIPIPVAQSGNNNADHGRMEALRRRSCLHADRAQRRPDQPEDRAGGEPARPEQPGSGRRRPAADPGHHRAPRGDDDRAARRPELHDRRPVAERGQGQRRAGSVAGQLAGARPAVREPLLPARRRPTSRSS